MTPGLMRADGCQIEINPERQEKCNDPGNTGYSKIVSLVRSWDADRLRFPWPRVYAGACQMRLAHVEPLVLEGQASDAATPALADSRMSDASAECQFTFRSRTFDPSADCLQYNHQGTIVVASLWLAFYLIAVILQ